MPLDNAQFIAEFSLTDPPGTDPVAEGDNHIRQVKIAVQQSFAFIDKAVTKTADQLNDVAQLSEANAFTEANSFAGTCTFTAVDNVFEQSFSIDAVTDNARNLFFNALGVTIWSLQMQAVAGDNRSFRFRRHNQTTGAFIDSPWEANADTGVVTFAHVPLVGTAPIWVAGELRMFVLNAGGIGTNWFIADGTNGTVNLNDRVLVGEGSSSPGTLLAPNLVGTAAAGTVGNTALTEAQMPAHDHRIWSGNQSGITDTTFAHASVQTVVGANRTNSGPAYALNNAVGTKIIENAGSGNTHNHTQSAAAVTENGSSRDTVRPLSAVVGYYQFVP